MRHLLFILLLIISSCVAPSRSPRKVQRTQKIVRPRPVKSMRVESINYIDKDFAALATPDKALNMAFKVGGQVDVITVAKGDFVSQGQLLVGLDPHDIELEVMANMSTYSEAQSKFERMERLYARQAVSKQDLEAAEAAYIRASSTYENSKELLAQTRLFAPFNGVVERVYIDTYERITSGQSIVRIVSSNTTQVEFTIAQSMLGGLTAPTTSFQVKFLQYPHLTFDASLKEFARSSSDGSGLPVSLTIDNADTESIVISPGLPCTVIMSIAESDKDLISLPLSAIYAPAHGGDYVWIVTDDNRVELRAVELDIAYSSNKAIINSGLEVGEVVVTAGVYQLYAGESVRVLN